MKSLVIQHRHELLHQNKEKFQWMYPNLNASIFNADTKDFTGDVVFASVQTLQRYEGQYPHFDLIATDEAHHAVASSYQKIYEGIKQVNPHIKHLGVTATPNRGDKQGLIKIYDNIADQIDIAELVESEHLVKPRVFVLDLGCHDALEKVYKDNQGKSEAFVLSEASHLLNIKAYNDEVVRLWKEHAGNRKTVLFASSVDHAKTMAQVFQEQDVSATHVNGEMTIEERTRRLEGFRQGQYQIVTNVAVLTEGWDCPEVSCVILLRPSSYKSTMIQMVGRGLRSHPGKQDCIILDFGMSSEKHGNLEQIVDLHLKPGTGPAPTKECSTCGYENHLSAKKCEYCGNVFPPRDETEEGHGIEKLTLKERTFLQDSLYKWEHLTGEIYAAQYFDTVLVLKNKENEKYAVFKKDYSQDYDNPQPFELVFMGTRTACFRKADKILDKRNRYGYCQKNSNFNLQPITSAQKGLLTKSAGKEKSHKVKTKYKAMLWISMLCQWDEIEEQLFDVT